MCAKTIGATNVVPDRLMPMGIFSALKSVLPFVEYVDLSGIWGEAFIKPDLYLEMLAVLKTHGIFVRTISNGTLIDGETAREIVRLGLDLLTVSVDAARPRNLPKDTPEGELSTLVAAVRRIGEEKKRQGRSAPRIEFMALGMRDTIEELPELVRLAGDLGVSRVGLQQMAEYRGMEGQSVAWRHREMGRKWSDAARTGRRGGRRGVLPDPARPVRGPAGDGDVQGSPWRAAHLRPQGLLPPVEDGRGDRGRGCHPMLRDVRFDGQSPNAEFQGDMERGAVQGVAEETYPPGRRRRPASPVPRAGGENPTRRPSCAWSGSSCFSPFGAPSGASLSWGARSPH